MSRPLVLLITLGECAKVTCTFLTWYCDYQVCYLVLCMEDPGIPKARYLEKPLKYLCIPGEVLNPKETPVGTALL
jgi:hypothetical protein